jgi:DNA-binding MarR family transcriptional regulator
MTAKDDLYRLRECVRILTRKLGLLEKNEASCCGVSLTQCHVLVELGRAGSITVNYLANMLGLDKSTMSRTINSLVEQDLVSREPDPGDRRCLSIGLTGNGQELFLNIEKNMEQYYQAACASLPGDKRDQVLESLEILVKSLPNKCC